MKIFTIIVTYNAMKWIDRCLQSLQASSLPTEIVVVDNGSQDETVAHIGSHYQQVHLFPQEKNLGFGQGNNFGIRYALQQGCDYVLLLNQDAWIDADMLSVLLPYDDGKTLLSPVHLNGEHTAIDQNFLKNAVIRSGYAKLLDSDALLSHTSGLHPAQEICAACWLIPRSILNNIGGFNPLFFHYNEDNNYQHRLFYHGYHIAWVGGTYVCHDREFRVRQPILYRRVLQELLLRSSDIRDNRLVAHARQWRYALGVIHEAMTQREPIAIWYLLRAATHLAFDFSGAVGASRKAEKQLQANWL